MLKPLLLLTPLLLIAATPAPKPKPLQRTDLWIDTPSSSWPGAALTVFSDGTRIQRLLFKESHAFATVHQEFLFQNSRLVRVYECIESGPLTCPPSNSYRRYDIANGKLTRLHQKGPDPGTSFPASTAATLLQNANEYKKFAHTNKPTPHFNVPHVPPAPPHPVPAFDNPPTARSMPACPYP